MWYTHTVLTACNHQNPVLLSEQQLLYVKRIVITNAVWFNTQELGVALQSENRKKMRRKEQIVLCAAYHAPNNVGKPS